MCTISLAKNVFGVTYPFMGLSLRSELLLKSYSTLSNLVNFCKERCQAKFLEGHLNELGLLIGPNKSGSLFNEAARFVSANQEA